MGWGGEWSDVNGMALWFQSCDGFRKCSRDDFHQRRTLFNCNVDSLEQCFFYFLIEQVRTGFGWSGVLWPYIRTSSGSGALILSPDVSSVFEVTNITYGCL